MTKPITIAQLRKMTHEEIVRSIDPNIGKLFRARREIILLTRQRDRLVAAAEKALLALESLTSEDFSLGKDRPAREALSAALEEVEMSR